MEIAWKARGKVNLPPHASVLHNGEDMGYHTGVAGAASIPSGQWRTQEVHPLYPGSEARSERPLVDAARTGDERAVAEL
jgi:hypothetical protein